MIKRTQKDLSDSVAEIVETVGKRRLAEVDPGAGLAEIITAFAGAEHSRLVYVVDHDRHLSGIISLGILSKHLLFHHHGPEIDNLHLMSMAMAETATDFIDRPPISATLSETIEPVLERMLSAGIKELPVLDEQGRVVADLTLVDILSLCAEELLNEPLEPGKE